MKKTLKFLIVLFSMTFLLFSCNSSKVENKETTIPDLISYYKINGYEGEFSMKIFSLIGAIGGGAYTGDNFKFYIYQFDTKAKAKNMEAYEHSYSKGYFAIIIDEGNEKDISELLFEF